MQAKNLADAKAKFDSSHAALKSIAGGKKDINTWLPEVGWQKLSWEKVACRQKIHCKHALNACVQSMFTMYILPISQVCEHLDEALKELGVKDINDGQVNLERDMEKYADILRSSGCTDLPQDVADAKDCCLHLHHCNLHIALPLQPSPSPQPLPLQAPPHRQHHNHHNPTHSTTTGWGKQLGVLGVCVGLWLQWWWW